MSGNLDSYQLSFVQKTQEMFYVVPFTLNFEL